MRWAMVALLLLLRVLLVAPKAAKKHGAARTWSVDATMSLWSEKQRCEGLDDVGVTTTTTRTTPKEKLVVAIASDSAELLPSLAVINSTATHSANVSVVAITTRKRALLELARRARGQLPRSLRLRVCDGLEDVLKRRPALAALRGLVTRNPNATTLRVRRLELLSPFNFAAFYLPHLLEAEEILYLDTDVVVRSDVRLLTARNRPIAAVEDCSQRLGKYVNFQLLRRLLATIGGGGGGDNDEHHHLHSDGGGGPGGGPGGGARHAHLNIERFQGGVDASVNEDTCVFNRGVVLFETKRWRDLQLSAQIEALIFSYVKSKAKLWRGGVSQPPFLVALAGRYKKLPLEWNVRGLGRVDLGKNELINLETIISRKRPASNGSFALLKANLSKIADFEKWSPFVAPLAHRAAVLHFTGEIKPWRLPPVAAQHPDRYGVAVTTTGHVASECLLDGFKTQPQRQRQRQRRRRRLLLEEEEEDDDEKDEKDRRKGSPRRRLSRRNSSGNFSSTTHFFSSGCFAKLPLCSIKDPRPDDRDFLRVESCANIWHSYVSDDARRIASDIDSGGLLSPRRKQTTDSDLDGSLSSDPSSSSDSASSSSSLGEMMRLSLQKKAGALEEPIWATPQQQRRHAHHHNHHRFRGDPPQGVPGRAPRRPGPGGMFPPSPPL